MRRPHRKDLPMQRSIAVFALWSLVAVRLLTGQAAVSAPLQTLVDAEHAFARAATEKGIRDSFLEYFAEDAIAFDPAPVSATARLRSRPSRPFRDAELRWEPRTGDVAASGELGWLTGPSTFTDHTTPGSKPQPGNYLSIWRRQADGPWRVFIDVGSQPPQGVGFAPGFTPLDLPSRYRGNAPQEADAAALRAADNDLNTRIGSDASTAYGAVTIAASRLHRNGFMPSIGPAQIGAWMRQHGHGMTASTSAAACARSGDLGYSYGSLDIAGDPQKHAYVRVWQRNAAGKWLVVADVMQ
jgi:ketosteroid isomerase-like protein